MAARIHRRISPDGNSPTYISLYSEYLPSTKQQRDNVISLAFTKYVSPSVREEKQSKKSRLCDSTERL